MAFRLGTNARKGATDAITSAVDQGSTNPSGKLVIYQNIVRGTQPATPQTSTNGDDKELVSINFQQPAFDNADNNGIATLRNQTPISGEVILAGTATWFRVLDRSGAAVFDGSVGTATDTPVPDMIFDQKDFALGATVTINTLSIQTPMSDEG